jgi:hypothetical protein
MNSLYKGNERSLFSESSDKMKKKENEKRISIIFLNMLTGSTSKYFRHLAA